MYCFLLKLIGKVFDKIVIGPSHCWDISTFYGISIKNSRFSDFCHQWSTNGQDNKSISSLLEFRVNSLAIAIDRLLHC